MTETDAKKLLEMMAEMWPDWKPTPKEFQAWEKSLLRYTTREAALAIDEAWELSRFSKPSQKDFFGSIRNWRIQNSGGRPEMQAPAFSMIFGSLCVEGKFMGKIHTEIVIFNETPTEERIVNDADRIGRNIASRFPHTKWLTWIGWGMLELVQERNRRGLDPDISNHFIGINRRIVHNATAVCPICRVEFIIPMLETTFGIPGNPPDLACPKCLPSHRYYQPGDDHISEPQFF